MQLDCYCVYVEIRFKGKGGGHEKSSPKKKLHPMHEMHLRAYHRQRPTKMHAPLLMNGQNDDLAMSGVMETLVMELRQQHGLADNCFGDRIIDKIVGQSNNSIAKARTILPQYIERTKNTFPEGFDELIILKYMDDNERSADMKEVPRKQQRQQDEVPRIIAYMEHTRYRPRLD